MKLKWIKTTLVVILIFSQLGNFNYVRSEPAISNNISCDKWFNVIRQQNESDVRNLIRAGVNVNLRDSTGRTALFYCAEAGNASLVQTLLIHGAKPNLQQPITASEDTSGDTPLSIAVRKRLGSYRKVIEMLLNKRANPNLHDSLMATPLLYACINDDLSVASLLLAHGAVPNVVGSGGQTPLGAACERGNYKLVALLYNAGAHVNPTFTHGDTPLMAVIPEGGSTLNDKDYAVHVSHLEDNELRLAIQQFLSSVPTPHSSTKEQGRLYTIKMRLMKFLLRNGAEVSATNQFGQTPLTIAAIQGNIEAIALLVAHGASVNSKTSDTGNTLLMETLTSHNTNALRFVLAHGANVNAKNRRGQTALLIAATFSYKDLSVDIEPLKVLLAHGAFIDAKDDDGYTALMREASIGNVDAVQYLVSKGANPNIRSKDGQTALRIALSRNFKLTSQMLRQAGAIE